MEPCVKKLPEYNFDYWAFILILAFFGLMIALGTKK